jgi:hypothetical protein
VRIGPRKVWNDLTVLDRRTYVRWISLRWALLLAVCCSLAACASSSDAGTSGGGRSPVDSTGRDQAGHGSLTARDYQIAKHVALREAEQSARSVTSATATRSVGTVTDSNTRHRCTAGAVLNIKLIGTFNIAHGHAPVEVRTSAGAPNDDVHAVVITADPDSGQMCLISVQTGEVQPDPGATVLFTDWTP